MRCYALRDGQWDPIKNFLPGRQGHVAGTAAGVDCSSKPFSIDTVPAFLGVIFQSVSVIGKSFAALQPMGQERVFEGIFKMLASDPDNEYMMRGGHTRTMPPTYRPNQQKP
jgi:hypothetical protein